MKKTICTVFLIIFLGGAYYTGNVNGTKKVKTLKKAHKKQTKKLKQKNRALKKDFLATKDSLSVLKDSIQKLNVLNEEPINQTKTGLKK